MDPATVTSTSVISGLNFEGFGFHVPGCPARNADHSFIPDKRFRVTPLRDRR